MGCAGCQTFTSASGTFSDGSGSDSYRSNANCEWVIAPPGASQITITFTEFSTEDKYDFVKVYQCTSPVCASRELLESLSGTYLNTQVATSTTGYMLVAFTSDGGSNSAGFTASWVDSTLTVGARVKRGPDWKWGDQDSGSELMLL
jgi:hypothetical protein